MADEKKYGPFAVKQTQSSIGWVATLYCAGDQIAEQRPLRKLSFKEQQLWISVTRERMRRAELATGVTWDDAMLGALKAALGPFADHTKATVGMVEDIEDALGRTPGKYRNAASVTPDRLRLKQTRTRWKR